MTVTATQPDAPVLPEQLSQRLQSLRVTVLLAGADGAARIEQGGSWIERVLVEAAPFQAALRQQWASLLQHPGEAVALWPGLWLVPLPNKRRRRRRAEQDAGPMPMALMLGSALIKAEQFRAICDSQQLDHRATAARIDRQQLLNESEVQRLAQTITWLHEDASQLDRRSGELQSLSNELAESYEELSLLYKLSGNMIVNQAPERFLTDACGELQQVVGLSWMALLLIDEPRLEQLRGKLFRAGPTQRDAETLTHVGRQLMGRFGDDPQPMVVDDTPNFGVEGLSAIADDLLIIPLRSNNHQLGILFGGDKLDDTKLSSVDSKLCDSLANSLTIFLENRMLYDDMQAMFMGTLHALTAAIDAKDSYTHGHSERVALMSRQLAEAAGLDEHTVERIYIAGLVHDVGKIGVPESVLCKPGKLTDEEFGLIKMHPEIGARILQDIRQMQDLLPGVLHHHERWDGRGYPHKLAGDDIPLFGRVIGLADAFDAMSSDRTYRQAMSLDTVLEEVRHCAGSQFDPELAEVFVQLDFTPFFELIEKHEHNKARSEPAAPHNASHNAGKDGGES